MDQVQPSRTGGSEPTSDRDKPLAEMAQAKTQQVAQTAKEQTRELGDEIARQSRNVAGQVRDRLSGEAQSQSERLSTTLRHLSEELEVMHKNAHGDSMASAMVQRLSEGSRQAADYLRDQGPDGVLHEVQEFARRKPGTFLLGAAVAGFVIGRLGKGMLSNAAANSNTNGGSTYRGTYDAAGGAEYAAGAEYPSSTDYVSGTEYPAGTTGTTSGTTGTTSGTTGTTSGTTPASTPKPAPPRGPGSTDRDLR